MYYKVLSQENTLVGVIDSSSETSKFYDGASWQEFENIGAVAESVGGDVSTVEKVEFDCLVAQLAIPARESTQGSSPNADVGASCGGCTAPETVAEATSTEVSNEPLTEAA